MSRAFAGESYRCAINNQHLGNIRGLINQYEEIARRNFLRDLPPYREKWETEYHDKIKHINSLKRNTLRYPDVYQNILLFDQRIDVIKDFNFESVYRRYMSPGWAYSLAEKEKKIAKERTQFKNDALLCKQVLQDCSDKIINEYIELFEECLKNKRACLSVYHDYSLLAYLNNNFDKSFELLFKLINQAQETHQIDQLDSKVYHDLGSVCVEVMAYDKAIKYLSEAIRLDPNNKEAYFQRATAYFETGNFDQAIQDYLMSDKTNTIAVSNKASKGFTEALITSVRQGAFESAIDFVPSLSGSIYGMSKTLWATHWSTHPLNPQVSENIKNFANACYEIGECIVDYCKNVDEETINSYIDQIKTIYTHYDQLSDTEKGEIIGYTVGRYSVDILAGALIGAGVAKRAQIVNKTVPLFSSIRNLKNVNRACNFDVMILSEAEKKAVLASSLEHTVARNNYFKNVKIHWDKQNKHITSKHNFLTGRGIITMETNEFETITKKYVGKGQRVEGSFGEGGYVERVDFEKIIGEYAEKINGEIKYTPTSKGIIKYAKDGAYHVIPSNPEAIIK